MSAEESTSTQTNTALGGKASTQTYASFQDNTSRPIEYIFRVVYSNWQASEMNVTLTRIYLKATINSGYKI